MLDTAYPSYKSQWFLTLFLTEDCVDGTDALLPDYNTCECNLTPSTTEDCENGQHVDPHIGLSCTITLSLAWGSWCQVLPLVCVKHEIDTSWFV